MNFLSTSQMTLKSCKSAVFELLLFFYLFIYFQVWDLEASLPTTASINIICTDAGGLTSKKLLSITVSAVNEFDPVISPTSMDVEVSKCASFLFCFIFLTP